MCWSLQSVHIHNLVCMHDLGSVGLNSFPNGDSPDREDTSVCNMCARLIIAGCSSAWTRARNAIPRSHFPSLHKGGDVKVCSQCCVLSGSCNWIQHSSEVADKHSSSLEEDKAHGLVPTYVTYMPMTSLLVNRVNCIRNCLHVFNFFT